MNALQDRRVQIAIGAAAALLLAVLLAIFMLRQPKPAAGQAKGGLQVDAMHDEARVSQTKPLRCFINGQYAGDFAVAECAKRNGVAAQALDVGLGGAPPPPAGAAPGQPPPVAVAPAPVAIAQPAAPPAPAAGECLRFVGGEWRTAGQGLSLGQCVRVLFEGRCVRPGDALYGRSGGLSVRLVPGRVEVSPDNRSFHPLMSQNEDCELAPG